MDALARGLVSPVLNQRGSVLVSAGAAMGLLIALLGAIDLGQMYYHKREFQKAADLAALAGSRQLASGCAAAVASGADNASANLAAFDGDTTTIQPGQWRSGTDPRFTSLLGAGNCDTDANSVRALVIGSVQTMFFGSVNVSASGTALAMDPIAQLTIRSGLAEFDTANSPVLDSVVGGLLGGSVSLTPVSWNGLANTDINLLSFLDALAVDTGVGAGKYDQLLGTDVELGDLLDVAADVLNQGGGSGDPSAVAAAISALGTLSGAGTLPGLSTPVQIGELLGISAGTRASALDTNVNLFQLVQGGVQLASGGNVASANLPVVGVPGVATASVKLKVIEPAQVSAIGNPSTDEIAVRTAQVRALISINLSGVTNLLNDLTTALSPFLNPVVNFLNTAGSSFTTLNLLGAVGNLLDDVFELLLNICNNNCTPRNVVYVEGLAQPLQISIDAAGAKAEVTDFACSTSKSLDVAADSSAAHLRIGSMTESDVFNSVTPTVNPLALAEIGYRRARARQCTVLLGIGNCVDEQWEQPNGSWLTNGKSTARRYVISGLGVKVDSTVAGSGSQDLLYQDPDLPEVGEDPEYQSISSTNVVNSLSSTLNDVTIQPYSSSASGVLGSALTGTLSLLNGTIDAVQGVVDNVLASLLDPLVNNLLQQLGLKLATADVGGNLSCDGGGGTLVE